MYLKLLDKHLKHGTLTVRFADGTKRSFGGGDPHVEWVLHERGALGRIMRDPELALGESYMDGAWTVGEGELVPLLQILIKNFAWMAQPRGLGIAAALAKVWQQLNRVSRSYRNVAHHYDLDESLFRLFLDERMHYSCAYFAHHGMSLEEAQQAKARHIMHKLRLEPGQRVLDIGCGWGSLALYLAENARVRVTGITLSREQLRVARERAHAAGLDAPGGTGSEAGVEFRLEDYREHEGRYDRIVSVGMFEHVGRPYYRRFFEQVRALLDSGGVALIHNIGRSAPPGTTNAWIRKYIFPGGYIPALSEMSAAIEHSGLITTDIEILRLHYAETLKAWGTRFRRHRTAIAERMGERFCRMWEFYLASCEAAFRWWDLDVFQVQLAGERTAVPMTRDYLYRAVTESVPTARAATSRLKGVASEG